MASSADRAWDILDEWCQRKSRIQARFRAFPEGGAMEVELEEVVRGVSIRLKRVETGEPGKPLDLSNAKIRLVSLPLPPEKATDFAELEFGAVVNIVWSDDPETLLVLAEIREYGRGMIHRGIRSFA